MPPPARVDDNNDGRRSTIRRFVRRIAKLPVDHPVQVAARTYVLSLSFSLLPAILPALTSKSRTKRTGKVARLARTLRNELSPRGFAFVMAIAIGGGAALDSAWNWIDAYDGKSDDEFEGNSLTAKVVHKLKTLSKILSLSPYYKTLISSSISSLAAILLFHTRRVSAQSTPRAHIPYTIPIAPSRRNALGRTSSTLDLTLMLFVRALDSTVQSSFARRAEALINSHVEKESLSYVHSIRAIAATMTDKLDALVFWAASSRIMWCFFYEQERLPRSYVKWIGALANIDERILRALRERRNGTWTYGEPNQSSPSLTSLANELGYPASWGDTSILPAEGGQQADQVWKSIGIRTRPGVGGVPCELVHGNAGSIFGSIGPSCSKNLLVRGMLGFLEGLAIYLPAHFLPVLLTRPRSLARSQTLKRLVVSVLRSSLFLTTFITSIWTFVCATRTVAVARLLPNISHNFYDGPFGCVLAGSLACGGSIWIEQGKRRGEIALYVLPRALRASIRDSWLRGGSSSAKIVESLTFMFSLATILTAARHRPESLRGLSHWTLSFILNGPKADFLSNRIHVDSR